MPESPARTAVLESPGAEQLYASTQVVAAYWVWLRPPTSPVPV